MVHSNYIFDNLLPNFTEINNTKHNFFKNKEHKVALSNNNHVYLFYKKIF